MSTENYGGYKFRYTKDRASPEKVRVYVENQPSYGGRSTNSNTIHRHPRKGNQPPHICFKENSKPSSLGKARTLSHNWANKTNTYIRTGVPISKQGG